VVTGPDTAIPALDETSKALPGSGSCETKLIYFAIRRVRSPLSLFAESTVSPILFVTVPLNEPADAVILP
jgi:hypothetical protein